MCIVWGMLLPNDQSAVAMPGSWCALISSLAEMLLRPGMDRVQQNCPEVIPIWMPSMTCFTEHH